MITNEFIGQRIKEVRTSKNLSQAKMGELIDVSFQQVQKYENAANGISIERLSLLAKKLNVPLNYFLGEDCNYYEPVILKKEIVQINKELEKLPEEKLTAIRDMVHAIKKL